MRNDGKDMAIENAIGAPIYKAHRIKLMFCWNFLASGDILVENGRILMIRFRMGSFERNGIQRCKDI